MVDTADKTGQQTKPRKAMTAARRALVEETFKRACGKKPAGPRDFDYLAELLAQCVAGDPANPIYVRAFLENLQKKHEAGKKGTGASRPGKGDSPRGTQKGTVPFSRSPFSGGLFKDRGTKRGLKKALARGEWDEAIRHGLEVLKANPWDVPTLTAMAAAARGAGDKDSELCYLKAALTKAPKDPTCNRMAAVVLDKMGLVNQAVVFWQRVAEALPKDKEAQWAISEFQIGAKSQGARRRRTEDQDQEEPAEEEQPAPKPLHVAAGPAPEQLDLAGDLEEESKLAEVCESTESADAEAGVRVIEKPDAARGWNRFDLLLLSGIVVLLLVLWFSLPRLHLWAWCLWLLDMRGWRWWTWTGVGVAMVGMFLTIYLWPERE